MKKALLTKEDVKSFIIEALNYEKVFSRSELLKYLHINNETLLKYLDLGLPWFGSVHRRKFKLTDVKKWLISNEIKTTIFNRL